MQSGTLIHHAFLQRAAERPDAPALVSPGGTVAYGELRRSSETLAGRMAAAAEGSREVVGILAERGPELIVAMLACAEAGRPFVVLDLAYPAARLEALIDICRPAQLLLAGARAGGGLPGSALPALAVELRAAGDGGSFERPPPAVSPDDPAYLLFTSGSTGEPKCVACSHQPLVHFVAWQAAEFGLSADDRFTLLSGLSHDPILRDVFTPLSLGAAIHIPDQATLTAPGALHAWFAAERPTVTHLTPPLGRLLTTVRPDAASLDDLRLAFFGGDVLRGGLVDALGLLAPGCEAVNFYGATETPQAIAFHRVAVGAVEDRVPIGRPVEGFELRLRGADGLQPEAGAPGELIVRSRWLTLGRVERGRLPDPALAPCEYATGDQAKWRGDGALTLLGRLDDQVKVRGYRVELAEISAAAQGEPGVGQALTLNAGSAEAPRLVCFVEPEGGAEVGRPALERRLRARLPSQMLPDEIVVVAAFPLLPNGKIDRRALTKAASRDGSAAPAATASSPLTARLAGEWAQIFPGRRITPESSFAGLAGDSLSYVAAYLSLEAALGEVPDGWTTKTLSELAPAAASPAPRRGLIVPVESAMVLRALAISGVVASHFGLLFTGDAATSALLWVSGFLFGGLQLSEAEHQRSATPLLRLLRSLLAPVYLIELPQVLVKYALHYHARLSSLLLDVDLIDFTGAPTSGPDAYWGHEYLMWYVHCVFHILLIYGVLLSVCVRLPRLRRPAAAAAIAALAIGLAARFVLPAWFVPDFGRTPVDGMSLFGHSPSATLATFGLAAMAGYLKGRARLTMMALSLVYALLSVPTYGVFDGASAALAGAVLLFAPRLPLPRVLVRPVYAVAGASLFIYLLQFKFLAVFTRLGLPMAVAWAGAIVGGLGAWRAWNWSVRRTALAWRALWKRPPRPSVALGLRRPALQHR